MELTEANPPKPEGTDGITLVLETISGVVIPPVGPCEWS